jgi:hypothetical protein
MRHGKTTPTREEAVQRNFKNLPALTSEFCYSTPIVIKPTLQQASVFPFYMNWRIIFYTQTGEWLADRINGGIGKIDSRT